MATAPLVGVWVAGLVAHFPPALEMHKAHREAFSQAPLSVRVVLERELDMAFRFVPLMRPPRIDSQEHALSWEKRGELHTTSERDTQDLRARGGARRSSASPARAPTKDGRTNAKRERERESLEGVFSRVSSSSSSSRERERFDRDAFQALSLEMVIFCRSLRRARAIWRSGSANPCATSPSRPAPWNLPGPECGVGTHTPLRETGGARHFARRALLPRTAVRGLIIPK